MLLPPILGDELEALALFKECTVTNLIQEFVKVGLLVSKHEDVVVCRVDELGNHHEMIVEGDDP